MLHCERLSVQVSCEQGLRMTSRREIERHEVWVWIAPGTEIDRRFYPGPFRLGHGRVSAQQIIKPKPGPPRNSAPTFDAYQPGNLLMHLEGCEQVPDVQRDT